MVEEKKEIKIPEEKKELKFPEEAKKQPSPFENLKEPYKSFYESHGVQLISINFPPSPSLLMKLYDKLIKGVFDANEYFQILDNEDEESFQ